MKHSAQFEHMKNFLEGKGVRELESVKTKSDAVRLVEKYENLLGYCLDRVTQNSLIAEVASVNKKEDAITENYTDQQIVDKFMAGQLELTEEVVAAQGRLGITEEKVDEVYGEGDKGYKAPEEKKKKKQVKQANEPVDDQVPEADEVAEADTVTKTESSPVVQAKIGTKVSCDGQEALITDISDDEGSEVTVTFKDGTDKVVKTAQLKPYTEADKKEAPAKDDKKKKKEELPADDTNLKTESEEESDSYEAIIDEMSDEDKKKLPPALVAAIEKKKGKAADKKDDEEGKEDDKAKDKKEVKEEGSEDDEAVAEIDTATLESALDRVPLTKEVREAIIAEYKSDAQKKFDNDKDAKLKKSNQDVDTNPEVLKTNPTNLPGGEGLPASTVNDIQPENTKKNEGEEEPGEEPVEEAKDEKGKEDKKDPKDEKKKKSDDDDDDEDEDAVDESVQTMFKTMFSIYNLISEGDIKGFIKNVIQEEDKVDEVLAQAVEAKLIVKEESDDSVVYSAGESE